MSTRHDDEQAPPPPERLIPLRLVPALPWLPPRPGDKPLHVATVYDWVKHGRRGVKLQVVRAAGSLCTSEPWLMQFFERLAAEPDTPGQSPVARTPGSRQRAHEAAERELSRAGI